ncbi:hypothetical protein BH23BAC4_BH23BAC4_01020 [soil metagenome]
MNLSPLWVDFFREEGVAAMHWSSVGAPDAGDAEIMEYARQQRMVIFTLDLDFTTALAHSQDKGPSVLQLRALNVLPEAAGKIALQAVRKFEAELEKGALVTVDVARARARLLPL